MPKIITMTVHVDKLLGMAQHLKLRRTDRGSYTSITGTVPGAEVRVPKAREVKGVEVVGLIPPPGITQRNIHYLTPNHSKIVFAYTSRTRGEELAVRDTERIFRCLGKFDNAGLVK